MCATVFIGDHKCASAEGVDDRRARLHAGSECIRVLRAFQPWKCDTKEEMLLSWKDKIPGGKILFSCIDEASSVHYHVSRHICSRFYAFTYREKNRVFHALLFSFTQINAKFFHAFTQKRWPPTQS